MSLIVKTKGSGSLNEAGFVPIAHSVRHSEALRKLGFPPPISGNFYGNHGAKILLHHSICAITQGGKNCDHD